MGEKDTNPSRNHIPTTTHASADDSNVAIQNSRLHVSVTVQQMNRTLPSGTASSAFFVGTSFIPGSSGMPKTSPMYSMTCWNRSILDGVASDAGLSSLGVDNGKEGKGDKGENEEEEEEEEEDAAARTPNPASSSARIWPSLRDGKCSNAPRKERRVVVSSDGIEGLL